MTKNEENKNVDQKNDDWNDKCSMYILKAHKKEQWLFGCITAMSS
jgi:hypothetical protein